jgi:mannose-6-phosphate isomerase-like protein (cupin superfamily)
MPDTSARLQSMQLPTAPDHLAPDGSAIRSLLAALGGSLAYCTLPAGAVSKAVVHQTVEEIWYCVAGAGQVWRRLPEEAQITDLAPGTCITIPVGAYFQFRTSGADELHLLIATMPPWPGSQEALPVAGYWEDTYSR